MKLVVPMSGLGSRFKAKGYADPKPLISVEGHPIISWVVKMFPGVSEVIFVCRESHLETTNMAEILKPLHPNTKILSVPGDKKGPAYALLQVASHLNFDEDVVFSYCDYYMHWDFKDFNEFVKKHKPDGVVPTYTGFHPNLIPAKNLYASCKTDVDGNLLEIREKFSFESDKTKADHSPGVYYFKSGKLALKYFQKAIDEDLSLNGEYYLSLIYNLLVKDHLKVQIYKGVTHFCQWGTPEDLHEYLNWMRDLKAMKETGR